MLWQIEAKIVWINQTGIFIFFTGIQDKVTIFEDVLLPLLPDSLYTFFIQLGCEDMLHGGYLHSENSNELETEFKTVTLGLVWVIIYLVIHA